MKKIISLLLIIGLLIGCTAKPQVSFTKEDASLTVESKTINPGMKYTTPLIPNWVTFTELTSCAYKGNDKVYEYDDFTLYTYSDGTDDYILSIELNSSLSTSKGIKIGSTKEAVLKAYGEEYTTKILNVIYTDGQVNITFLIVEDKVSAISLNYRPE
ncbi:MAG: hypothetical protein HGB31_04270 [Erysipelotrichaceae bacterium]|nr:hypothetical protein [Erysipelotrichaceae bacterium]